MRDVGSCPDALVRIGVAGVGDPDLMIGKNSVAIRERHFWHMATDAILLRDRARLSRLGRMTSQASAIVTGFVARQAGVRIVASGAADALVVAQEALAVRQPVRRKPDIDFAPLPRPDDELPSAMTLAAKIRHVLGAQLT